MVIRTFQREDANAVAERMVALLEHIRNESQDPYFIWDKLDPASLRADLLSTLEAADRQIYVAEVEGQLVGFLYAAVVPCFLPFSRVRSVGQIFAAYLDPDQRGKGLIEALEKEARGFFLRHNLAYVELHVLSKNSVGVRSWKRLGYSTFREQMRKPLL
jgi:GNAT superfamily N-acetyltransferase